MPVERFFSAETAALINVWFLAVVALWRVALLVTFLKRRAELWPGEVFVVALLPLTFLVTALTALNLEQVVFDLMSGNAGPVNPHGGAYVVLLVLTVLSLWAVVPLLIAYVALIIRARRAAIELP